MVDILPDLVGPSPSVVLCGLTTAGCARTWQSYYEGAGNAFWELLHTSGLTPQRLRPQDDTRVVEFGLGLTDLVRHLPEQPGGAPSYDLDELAAKVAGWQPEWLAFTSKTVAAVAARGLGERRPPLGPAPWELGGAPVFVLPGTSGANHRRDYDGRPDRLSWWSDLAALVGRGH